MKNIVIALMLKQVAACFSVTLCSNTFRIHNSRLRRVSRAFWW